MATAITDDVKTVMLHEHIYSKGIKGLTNHDAEIL
jgi:hypothetical protein